MIRELSAFAAKVKELGITFSFFHVLCKMRDVEGKPLEYPEDLWYVSATYGEKVFHSEFTTRTGARVLDRSVKKENGAYYYSLGAGQWYKNEAELITAGLLRLPNKTDFGNRQSIQDERMWKLGVDFLHSSVTDALSASESFNSWCSEFGESSDSIKALQTYLTCQKTRDKLIAAFGNEVFYQLSQLEH